MKKQIIETTYGTIELRETTEEDAKANEEMQALFEDPQQFEHGFYATFISGRATQQFFGKCSVDAIDEAIKTAAKQDAGKESIRVQYLCEF